MVKIFLHIYSHARKFINPGQCDEENVKEEESLEQDSQQQLVPSEKSGDIENLGKDAPMEESYSPKNGAPSSLLGKQPSLFSMNSDHTLNVGRCMRMQMGYGSLSYIACAKRLR